MSVRNVAVIGGGVSGLGVAYFLNQKGVNVTVYEAVHHVGGNCRTVPVPSVGQAIPGGTNPWFKRWVDLGVNDFNKNSYTEIVGMLDRLGVPYAPLEDTISFFGVGNGGTIPGSGYTMDTTWANIIPATIQAGNNQFAAYVSANINEFLQPSGKFFNATMGQFLSDPTVSANYPELRFGSDFVNYNLFPHINAMYFATGIAPSDMPARMVIHYFNLQEGYGTGRGADRMYWVNGAHSWIAALAQDLTDKGVRIFTGTKAQFEYTGGGVVVTTDGNSPGGTFDAVVLGVQAWQLRSIFANQRAVPPYIDEIVNAITYSSDEVVVHASTGELPANVSAWRTYNVNMYDHPNQGQPYRMSYVVNRHQNDSASKNPIINNANDPLYFCTLNPRNPIPPDAYLLGPQSSFLPPGCTMFNFYHTILGMRAQYCQDVTIPGVQGQNRVWLVGGYTCGTGLQEECWEAARNIATKMLNPAHEFDHIYNREKSGREGIPQYIRKRLQ
ncbi:MAG: hypothetical protein AUJ55_02145 [Proteobacteria bacterium CG1_02_64_396]|nr:MAG: hypothetical protein AUJ55_02145 [Proteobacteria bacterium CG1_02_64_396]